MWSALAGNDDICQMLVHDYELKVDYATEKGETALMKAAAKGHWDVCEFLLEEGAKVQHADNEGQTALMWAAAEGHIQTVKGLVAAREREAGSHAITRLGFTSLLFAAMFGRDEICQFLIEKQAGVDHQDVEGKTALFGAVEAGHPHLCEMLLEKKCPIESHTKRGETALMWAAKHQELQCLQVLLNAQANIHVQDENGQKALDHAEGTLNSHVVELLREAAKSQVEES